MDSPITTPVALLWALGQGRAHGAELAARLRVRTNGVITIPDGTLYPALRGLVESRLAQELHEPGTRRQFELTQLGQLHLANAAAAIAALFGPKRRRKTVAR